MFEMLETGSTRDVVGAAARYREQLIAEIDLVDAFLRTAEELTSGEAAACLRFEHAEAQQPLH